MDWEDLRHFAAFAESGSLSGAARRLGVEHATIGRRIAALEAALGLKLVDRRGRRLTLTADGARVAATGLKMSEEALALRRLADGARATITGEVTISAPPAYGALVLMPKLATLAIEHPGLRLRVIGEARMASLDRREADIAIRLSRPETGDVAIRRIDAMIFRLYASPAYLAATPSSQRRFIGSDGAMETSPQQAAIARLAGGNSFALLADHAEIQLAAAAAGMGIAILPDFMAADDPRLVAIEDGQEPLRRDVFLVVHEDLRQAAPLRAVIDILAS